MKVWRGDLGGFEEPPRVRRGGWREGGGGRGEKGKWEGEKSGRSGTDYINRFTYQL